VRAYINAGRLASYIERIYLAWAELYSNPLREEERREIGAHLELCQAELATLIERSRAFE
jgi:hypothetical protein